MASGGAGLIYQVVWTRDLVLIFGNTTQAIVTTVTAFLAGLGIGSLLGAAIGPKLRRPLSLYGALEIAVACFALLMSFAFDAIATVFRSAVSISSPGGSGPHPVRACLLRSDSCDAANGHDLACADPSPRYGRSGRWGEERASVRDWNTLGAVVGTVVSGFLLIELIGLRGTTLVAVALNVIAGTGALLISRRVPLARRKRPEVAKRSIPLRRRQVLLLVVTFSSGLVSLAMEILWTRVLLQSTGSSIYIFVAVLAVFLIGIAGGSLVYERHKSRTPRVTTLEHVSPALPHSRSCR